MNFSVDESDAWDSTPSQERFIQEYFGKIEPTANKKVRKRKKEKFAGRKSVNIFSSNDLPIKLSNIKQNNSKKLKFDSSADLKPTNGISPEEGQIKNKCKRINTTLKQKCKSDISTSNNLGKSCTNAFLSGNDSNTVMSSNLKNICQTSKIKEKTLSHDSDNTEKFSIPKNNSCDLDQNNPSYPKIKNIPSYQQTLKKKTSKGNMIEQISNEKSVLKKGLPKAGKQTANYIEKLQIIYESKEPQKEVSPQKVENQHKNDFKKKSKKLVKIKNVKDETRIEIKEVKKKSSRLHLNDSMKDDESEDTVSPKKVGNQQTSSFKITSRKLVKVKSPKYETDAQVNKVRKFSVPGSKDCLEYAESSDDEDIRNDIQNSRMFLKIQKLLKVAPHLNPNFSANSKKVEDWMSENISSEYSSSQSEGDYSSDESEVMLKDTENYSSKKDLKGSRSNNKELENNIDDVVSRDEEKLSENDAENSGSDTNDFTKEDTEKDYEESSSSEEEKKITSVSYQLGKPTEIQKKSNLKRPSSFMDKARAKLAAAKFRFLNEKLYTETGEEAFRYFQDNEHEFEDYHLGFEQQVSKWPINPVDVILADLQKLKKNTVIADLGCGEAKIARVLIDRPVHSFDLVALNECVTVCDFSKVPLPDNSVDVAVFCLSLMGVNLMDYLREAYRILKMGATLKIAEVESRIDDLNHFINNLRTLGFVLLQKNIKNKLFVFLDFKKTKKGKNLKSTSLTLRPCLYKKR